MNENNEGGNFYLYYPEVTPDELPTVCELFDVDGWIKESVHPRYWGIPTRRWPVKEWQYRAHHWMKANMVECPEGYEVIGFGPTLCGHIFLSINGSPCKGSSLQSVPILKTREPEIEWVTPTDEDACHRPEVQVKQENSPDWKTATLIAVMSSGQTPYRTTINGQNLSAWGMCRMDAKLRDRWNNIWED